jgi:cell wall-associated NlpC family hydrolase
MMKRLFAIGLLCCAAVLSGYGDEDTFKNVYHSLSRIGNSVRNTFTEDSGGRPSPTPGHHGKLAAKHLSSKKTPDKHSQSATREWKGSDEASKAKPVSESSTKPKEDTPGPAAGDRKPDSNPSSTPSTDEETGSDSQKKSEPAAPMATIKPDALREFSDQPAKVQELIRSSLALTERNLSYKYGSADPGAGGMDCSGFIYYVLTNAGYKDVPRDSSGQYAWVRKQGDFHAVLSRSGESFELNDLSPGDLLFWSGTYKINRDIPITHVMIYLGKEKSTGKPVMVGATDGRSYNGVRRFGVSVFDFKMPSGKPNTADPDLTAKFEGYASIPHLRETGEASKTQVSPEKRIKSDKETPDVKVKPKTTTLGDGD